MSPSASSHAFRVRSRPPQLEELARRLDIDDQDPWAAFAPDSAEGRLCRAAEVRLSRDAVAMTPPPSVPEDFGRTPQGTATTQAALGRMLLDLVRQAPEAAARVVTVAPDVSSSTNLGGISYEPAFALDTEWCMLASLGRLARPGGSSAYLRLSTRPVDQALAAIPEDPAARERRRRLVVAGGYLLRRAAEPVVTIAAMGAMVPEALEAAARLAAFGIDVDVLCITSPGLLFAAIQARRGRDASSSWILDQLLPGDRARPLVTLLDGHPHTLAFLATVHGVPSVNLGVTGFGQSGGIGDVYREHGIDSDAVVRAVLDLV